MNCLCVGFYKIKIKTCVLSFQIRKYKLLASFTTILHIVIKNSVFSQGLNNTTKKYHELQKKFGSLAGESGNLTNINKKAMDMKNEAEELLNKAIKKIDQLRSEYKYKQIFLDR